MDKDTRSLIQNELLYSASTGDVSFHKTTVPSVQITLQSPLAFKNKGKEVVIPRGDVAIIQADGNLRFFGQREATKYIDSMSITPIYTKARIEKEIIPNGNSYYQKTNSVEAEVYRQALSKHVIPHTITVLEDNETKETIIKIAFPEKFKEKAAQILENCKEAMRRDIVKSRIDSEMDIKDHYYKSVTSRAENFLKYQIMVRTLNNTERDPQNLETKEKEMRMEKIINDIKQQASVCIDHCSTLIGMIENNHRDEIGFKKAKNNLVSDLKKMEDKLIEEFKKEPDAPLYYQIKEIEMLKQLQKEAEELSIERGTTPPKLLKEKLNRYQNENYYIISRKALLDIRENLGYDEMQGLISSLADGHVKTGDGTKTQEAARLNTHTETTNSTVSAVKQDIPTHPDVKTNHDVDVDDILNQPSKPMSVADLYKGYESPEQEDFERTRFPNN